MTHRRQLALAAACYVLATGCSGGGGCDCVAPIPGGFPSEERVPNAVQVRVTPTGLDASEADPAGLVAGLIGGDMGLTFDIPPACGEGDNPAICCEPIDGPIVEPCGPIEIDLAEQPGDAPRLVITPVAGASRLDVTVRARVRTVEDLAIWYDTGIFGTVNCGVVIDTTAGGADDLLVTTTIDFVQDPEAGTTRLSVGDVNIDQLDNADISLNGGFTCDFANLLIGFFTDSLIGGFGDTIREQIEDAVCKSCPSGDVSECGEFADACEGGVCMKGTECLQEVGISGRLLASSVLSSLSPGQPGAVDMYLVAGGYADTDDDGLSLGMLGGALGADEAARCGPPADPPADVAIPQSAFFEGNTRPDTGNPFDVGIGVHQNEIDRFAWAAYDGGLLCINVGTGTVDLLNSDTMALLMPSLTDLLHGTTGQLVLGLRPQQPPTMALGAGTFTETGDIDEPLLDVRFENMEVDFFAMIDDQFVRVMTMVTDVALPIGLDVTPDGELLPVIGDVDNAFTNISVINVKGLLETPQELADRLPAVLSVALPFLSDAFGPIALPQLGGLSLSIQEDGITSVESNSFLAIFADMVVGSAMAGPRVVTEADIVAIHVPEREAFLARKLDREQRPVVEIALGGMRDDGLGADLEFSYRLNGSLWSPYKRDRRLYVSRDEMWLVGEHVIEVRAREVGKPLTADRTPVVLRALVDTSPSLLPVRAGEPHPDVRGEIGFHGRTTGGGGCECGVAGDRGAGSSLALGLLVAGLLWLRRRRDWLTAAVIAAALLAPAGCSCGSDSTGDCDDCIDGEVEHGPTGRYSSMAADDTRVVISAYDEGLGDLVLIEVAEDGSMTEQPVDGVPDVPPAYDPSGYRGGIADPGENVGTWTSVGLRDGAAHIAYQDVDNGALKYAREGEDGWAIHVVDAGMGGTAGLYTSLAFGANGNPSIAYMAHAVDDGAGGRTSQLRIAEASTATPSSTGDWTITVIDEAAIPCTGLCSGSEVCVADTLVCAPPSSGCAAECGSGQECVADVCTDILEWVAHDIPEGTGLFADLGFLPDGSPAIVYYDRTTGDLVMQQYSGAWTRVELDAAADTDTGMWASAEIAGDGTVHVAYQDALRDRLLYRSWSGGTASAVEVIDDGTRDGERSHHVGAGAELILDGNGAPAVVYQDAEDGALRVARRDGTGAWTGASLVSGESLVGFYNSMAHRGGTVRVSTYVYDRDTYPPGKLQVTSLP